MLLRHAEIRPDDSDTGYIYVLCHASSSIYLDIYTADGVFLSRTTNFSGVKIIVDNWRSVYAANLEIVSQNGQVPFSSVSEPTISYWLPSTP